MTSTQAEIDILLVEDNRDDARFVERCVRRNQPDATSPDVGRSLEVTTIDRAERLEEAIELLGRTQPDVILLDLTLPDSSGLETVEWVVDYAPRIPVVVLTGRDDAGIGVEAIKRGAQDYLRKSEIRGSLLRQTLRYAIERERNQRALRDRNHRLALLNRIVCQDLRNDVSMIVGRADELRSSVRANATLDALLDAARRASDLVDTTGELMEVLSAEGVEPTPCNLEVVLESAIARVEAERTVDVTVESGIPAESVTVFGSSMLESAFRHLLVTLIDFADVTSPVVTVDVTASPDHASVAFNQPQVSLPESRTDFLADPATDPDDNRIGIGFYLVRTVLDAVDGTVTVDEDHSDGTTVTIDLDRTVTG